MSGGTKPGLSISCPSQSPGFSLPPSFQIPLSFHLWAAFCIFHISKRARGCLVCVVYVFWWRTFINVPHRDSRTGYLSWVRAWRGLERQAPSPCLSVWTPVCSAGILTVFTPVEWRVKPSWGLERMFTVGSQRSLKTLSQEWKNARLTMALKVPNWKASRNSTFLDPCSYFQNTMDVEIISSHNIQSEKLFWWKLTLFLF